MFTCAFYQHGYYRCADICTYGFKLTQRTDTYSATTNKTTWSYY